MVAIVAAEGGGGTGARSVAALWVGGDLLDPKIFPLELRTRIVIVVSTRHLNRSGKLGRGVSVPSGGMGLLSSAQVAGIGGNICGCAAETNAPAVASPAIPAPLPPADADGALPWWSLITGALLAYQ